MSDYQHLKNAQWDYYDYSIHSFKRRAAIGRQGDGLPSREDYTSCVTEAVRQCAAFTANHFLPKKEIISPVSGLRKHNVFRGIFSQTASVFWFVRLSFDADTCSGFSWNLMKDLTILKTCYHTKMEVTPIFKVKQI